MFDSGCRDQQVHIADLLTLVAGKQAPHDSIALHNRLGERENVLAGEEVIKRRQRLLRVPRIVGAMIELAVTDQAER